MISVLMLGGTGAIGESILSIIGNNKNYSITVTSRAQRISKYNNVKYICGNANDLNFINTFENNSYDVLIDFMNYRNEILEANISKLIEIANQYIFLSSARVYDNSQEIIDENCSLLLNSTNNLKFKNSGTYAVKKAYQEDFVKKIGGKKVTIIHPYKTYSAERLQLGEYEISHWLHRIVNGKPIILNKSILSKYTSLTHGNDCAIGIIALMGNYKAYGETYQIVTNEYMTWNEVLNIYTSELKKHLINPVIYVTENTKEIDSFFENGWQMPYDILYDRKFNSKKISEFINIKYKSMNLGLKEAISEYLYFNAKKDFQQSDYDKVVDKLVNNNKFELWKDDNYA